MSAAAISASEVLILIAVCSPSYHLWSRIKSILAKTSRIDQKQVDLPW